MPGVPQVNFPLVVHNGCPGPHPVAQLCLGKNHIQLNEDLVILCDGLPVRCRLGRQFGQNPLNFLLLFQFQFPEGVIGVDRRHGLNEISRSGCGNIMHQSGDIIFAFALHRHHIPSLPDGNNGFPQEFGVSWGGNDFLKTIPDFGRLYPHMSTDFSQSGRCVVCNFLFRQDRSENFIFQIFVRTQPVEKRVQYRLFFVLRNIGLYGSGAAEHPRDPQKFNRLKTAAPVSPLQRRRDISYISKNRVSFLGT